MLTKHWTKTEARIFSDVAVKMGVPENRILIEEESTNTGENVEFCRRLLLLAEDTDARGVGRESFIVVQKPYMLRRTYATFHKVFFFFFSYALGVMGLGSGLVSLFFAPK